MCLTVRDATPRIRNGKCGEITSCICACLSREWSFVLSLCQNSPTIPMCALFQHNTFCPHTKDLWLMLLERISNQLDPMKAVAAVIYRGTWFRPGYLTLHREERRRNLMPCTFKCQLLLDLFTMIHMTAFGVFSSHIVFLTIIRLNSRPNNWSNICRFVLSLV